MLIGDPDVTMLASDMRAHEIPKDHPDAINFLPQQLLQDQLFDLVICDGPFLRTQSYREPIEARMLTVTQLAPGLEHLQPEGTMVIFFISLKYRIQRSWSGLSPNLLLWAY